MHKLWFMIPMTPRPESIVHVFPDAQLVHAASISRTPKPTDDQLVLHGVVGEVL